MRPFKLMLTLALTGLLAAQMNTSVRAQSNTAPASPSDKMGEIARSLGNDALRLKTETEQGLKKLDGLEEQLKQNTQGTRDARKTVEELLSLLGQAADRLKPDAVYRRTLKTEEVLVREYASRASSHTDPEIHKLANSFKSKADEIAALERDAEQLRTRFLGQIDRLKQQKDRLEFSTALAQIDEFIKNAHAYFDTLNGMATSTKKLADDLENAFGTTKPTQ